jgi:molybdopterin synthase sulfur carrier subunit
MTDDGAMQPQADPVRASATVTLHIPGSLSEFSGAESAVALEAASVRELLARLAQERPRLYAGICDETGRIRKHMNLFVNHKHIRDREGLETPLAPGDALYAWPAVSGG